MTEDRPHGTKQHEELVTWSSLPHKGQLCLLTLARMSEPLTQTSLQAYMFYQLRSFDPSLPDSAISQQAGLLAGAFTGAQCLTAMIWGRLADSERVGRKKVILVSLASTAVSALGFGFSKTFTQAMLFRLLGGLLNGNVGVMRTMVSEIIKEKRFQSRAFLLLPMTFNIGVIIGPILGGILADPAGTYPSLFGPGSTFGGKEGVSWMLKWPYALPNIVSAVFLAISSITVFLGLQETHQDLCDSPDIGRRLGTWLKSTLLRKPPTNEYTALAGDEETASTASTSIELHDSPTTPIRPRLQIPPLPSPPPAPRRKLPFRRIWTPNLITTLVAHAFLAIHVGTFNNVWFVFLSAARFDPQHPHPPSLTHQSPPLHFTGGLALPPPKIGLALAILGAIGITLQLLVYPTVSTRLGVVRSYRASLVCFPVAYALVPFLALIPSTSAPPLPVEGVLVWLAIGAVLFVQVCGRTFALPGTQILVNNACPHPSVLGTVHGIAQSVSSAVRTVGPVLFGWLFGRGLGLGVVGLAWWFLGAVALGGVVAGGWVRMGSGHEVWLEGEKRDDEEEDR